MENNIKDVLEKLVEKRIQQINGIVGFFEENVVQNADLSEVLKEKELLVKYLIKN